MSEIRKLIRKIPGTIYLYRKMINLKYRLISTEKVFTTIYRGNLWGGHNSISGVGSDPEQTKIVIEKLPQLIKTFKIRSMLDIPCGDFLWMKKVDLREVSYHGGDIVNPLIEENNRLYASENIRFSKINLLEDPLPCVDMILCRDCLVHFSFHNIRLALTNILKSGSTYLLTTTFDQRTKNADITTGRWRPLNLMAPPFRFPPPLMEIDEQCTAADGNYRDKKLYIWKLTDLSDSIAKDYNKNCVG